MKRGVFYKPYAYGLLVLFLTIAGFFGVGYRDTDRWDEAELTDGDEVLCERKHNGDYFFIGRRREKIMTGYRINVTGKGHMPLAYVITWRFRDENGEHIETDIPTKVVSSGYVHVEDTTYAREVAVRQLYLDDTKELSAIILLYKYEYTEGDQSVMTQDIDNKLVEVAECHFPVH